MDDKENLIQSEEHFRHIQESMRKAELKEDRVKFTHLEVLNQTLKTIDIMPLDPFVKRVLCKKLVSPLYNGGVAVSNMSIALEFGASIDDVDQAEIYGVNAITEFLESTDLQSAIDKFNKDVMVEKAVANMGNLVNNKLPK